MARSSGGFDAGNIGLRPTETGIDAAVQGARRLGAFYNQQSGATEMLARETIRLGALTDQLGRQTEQLGSEKGADMAAAGRAIGSGISAAGDAAVAYETHQNISHGGAAWATLLQQTSQDWDNKVKNADPNDPHVAADFMESLNDKLEKFQGNGFVTEDAQKWAEAHVEALRQHMAEKTTSDMSTLAGQAVIQNHRQTVNSLSATVHGDPQSLDFALAGLKSSAEGLISSSPNLRGTDVSRVRTEMQQSGAEAIVKSAAIGYIEKTGKMPDWIGDPKYSPYVNGAELKMLEKQAQVQQKADLLQSKQLETYQRQQDERAANDAMTKSMTDNFKADENGNISINPRAVKDALDIARKYPAAGAAPARAMIDFVQAQQDKGLKAVDKPETVKDLTDRLFDPTNPTKAIDLMRARAKGEISDHTFTTMNGMVKELESTPLSGPIYQDTMKAVHSSLVLTGVGVPGKDDVGEKKYAQFMQNFLPQYLAKYRAGTLEPNALDVGDPNSMISKSMEPFKRNLNDRINDYLAVLGKDNSSQPIAMQGVPPPAQRQVGSIYDTPKGKMKWTGTGWVAP